MICLICGEDDLKYFFELINYDGSLRYECGICNGSYIKPEPEPEPTTTIQPEPEPEPKPKPEKIKRKKITTKQILIPKKLRNNDRYRLSKLLKYKI